MAAGSSPLVPGAEKALGCWGGSERKVQLGGAEEGDAVTDRWRWPWIQATVAHIASRGDVGARVERDGRGIAEVDAMDFGHGTATTTFPDVYVADKGIAACGFSSLFMDCFKIMENVLEKQENLLAFEFEVRQWGCDKRYDIRGEGACLKRYTDSSFNTGFACSRMLEPITQRLRTYSFSLHLKIAYYYFPGVVLNFLNITHILDALVTTNNVITEQEVHAARPNL
uniref:Uncharacterized protein n=1 Tax=Oryza nivara TaxID=4536 RepID=A0A0E0FYN5_ORYNI